MLRSLRAQVERDGEVAAVREDFGDVGETREGGVRLGHSVGGDDALDVPVSQKALCLVARVLVHRVDEKDFASALGRLLGTAEEDTGLHRTVVEEARAEPKDAVDEVGFDDALAHLALLVAEEHAVWEKDGAAPARRR